MVFQEEIYVTRSSFISLHSRRDDLESLGYMLTYFIKGKLPWEDIQDPAELKQRKMTISFDELCEVSLHHNYLVIDRHLLLEYESGIFIQPVASLATKKGQKQNSSNFKSYPCTFEEFQRALESFI